MGLDNQARIIVEKNIDSAVENPERAEKHFVLFWRGKALNQT